mmetsp:Transcript_10819/g.49158  ORF Transcript_10819/g.49158 Transcript_10819/m.49158 type:complete len:223 (-) Transcript_10819:4-672(-)
MRSFLSSSSFRLAASASFATLGLSSSQSSPTFSSIHRMPSSTPVSAAPLSPLPPSVVRNAVHGTTWCRSFCSVVSPSAVATSSVVFAPGASCLFAKMTTGLPLRCGSRNVSAKTSLHSSSLASSLESTTNAHPCTSAMYAFQIPRIFRPPPRSKTSTSNPPRVNDSLLKPNVGMVDSGAWPSSVCSSVDLPAPSKPTSTSLRFLPVFLPFLPPPLPSSPPII